MMDAADPTGLLMVSKPYDVSRSRHALQHECHTAETNYFDSFVLRMVPLRSEASACRASSSLSNTLTAHCNTLLQLTAASENCCWIDSGWKKQLADRRSMDPLTASRITHHVHQQAEFEVLQIPLLLQVFKVCISGKQLLLEILNVKLLSSSRPCA